MIDWLGREVTGSREQPVDAPPKQFTFDTVFPPGIQSGVGREVVVRKSQKKVFCVKGSDRQCMVVELRM